MKVLFVGPSLPDAAAMAGADIVVRPPATQGDVLAVVEEGARMVGLIDGGFEYTAPVWHKEILYGLSKGVTILGAASMGALRAAECHSFGMIGVGRIFEDYRDGLAVDDADVALLHAPREMQHRSLTVPMVNVRATLLQAKTDAVITVQEAEWLERSAMQIFFKERSWGAIVRGCSDLAEERKFDMTKSLPARQVDQKRLDAIMLMDCLKSSRPTTASARDWIFQETSIWREAVAQSHE